MTHWHASRGRTARDGPAASDAELIELIYAAVLGETGWQSFLDRLSTSLPGGKSSLFYYDPTRNRGASSLSSGIDDDQVESFAQHYSSINPLTANAATLPIGRGIMAERVCPRETFRRSEFYNDYFRPMGVQSAIGLTLMRDNGYCFFLTGLTAEADGDESVVHEECFGRLHPHLRRAFDFYRTTGTDPQTGGQSLLDAAGCGVVVCAEDMRATKVSRTAERLIDEGCGVEISLAGRVRLKDEALNGRLRRMVDRFAPRGQVASARTCRHRLTLITMEAEGFAAFARGPSVAILIEPLAQEAGIDLAALAQHYRLTRAERRALSGLLEGMRAEDVAQAANLSRETVRSQIKSLYAKLEVSSQVELIALVGFRPGNGTRGPLRPWSRQAPDSA